MPTNPTEAGDSRGSLLVARIADRACTVGIVGLGYVGLPLVRAATRAGFKVLGFDIDEAKVNGLNAGRSPLTHMPEPDILALVETGQFEATALLERLVEADAVLVCVPTPLDEHREPDLGCVVRSVEGLVRVMKPGSLLVLESTTYPGTTRDVVLPLLRAAGRRPGTDLLVAYSPEREDPGNPAYETSSIPKIVGADDDEARAAVKALYEAFVDKVVPVSSTAVAEAVKITENVFRAVNIALVNELKLIYTAMGIDVWEVINAAKTKPFGYMPFYPGPGLGGHCIPIDPFYLTWKARAYSVPTRFIELAGEINTSMPLHVVHRLAEELDQRQGSGLRGRRILVLGVAYKRDVNDVRESPALLIMDLLQKRGAEVAYHDPYVPVILPNRQHPGLAGLASQSLDAATLAGFDAALVVTDHRAVDYALVAEACPLVVDTRNAVPRRGNVAQA